MNNDLKEPFESIAEILAFLTVTIVTVLSILALAFLFRDFFCLMP